MMHHRFVLSALSILLAAAFHVVKIKGGKPTLETLLEETVR